MPTLTTPASGDPTSLGNAEPYQDMTPQSPTTLVLNYLKAKGLQASSDNVRRTLEESARDPSLIPGLRTEQPPPAEERNPSSLNKSVADKIETNAGSGPQAAAGNPPPADLTKVAGADEVNWKPETSSQPTSGGLDLGGLAAAILGGGGLAGLGGYGAYRALTGGTPTPGGGVELNPEARALAGPPDAATTGDRYLLESGAPPTALESPMQKAIAGPKPPLALPAPTPAPTPAIPMPPPSNAIPMPPPERPPVDFQSPIPPRGPAGAVRPLAPRPYVPRIPIR